MEEVLTIHLPGEIRKMLNRTSEELARDVRLYLGRIGQIYSLRCSPRSTSRSRFC
jgi:hypothetical protein